MKTAKQKLIKTRNTTALRRQGYAHRPMRQTGSFIVLNSYVTKRTATLVRTEAAIHNKSVSAMLNDILESRYSNVK